MRTLEPITHRQADPWLSSTKIFHFMESVAVTFAWCVVQTIALFGMRLDSWIHELSNFLHHYENASQLSRLPVNLVLAAGFMLNLVVVVIARRKRGGVDDG